MLRERNRKTLEDQSSLSKAVNLGAGSYSESDIPMGEKIPLRGAKEVVRADSNTGEVAGGASENDTSALCTAPYYPNIGLGYSSKDITNTCPISPSSNAKRNLLTTHFSVVLLRTAVEHIESSR